MRCLDIQRHLHAVRRWFKGRESYGLHHHPRREHGHRVSLRRRQRGCRRDLRIPLPLAGAEVPADSDDGGKGDSEQERDRKGPGSEPSGPRNVAPFGELAL